MISLRRYGGEYLIFWSARHYDEELDLRVVSSFPREDHPMQFSDPRTICQSSDETRSLREYPLHHFQEQRMLQE